MILKRLLAEKRTVSLTTRRDFDDRDSKEATRGDQRAQMAEIAEKEMVTRDHTVPWKQEFTENDEILMNRY